MTSRRLAVGVAVILLASLLAALVLLWSAAGGPTASPTATPIILGGGPRAGKPAPEIALQDASGRTVRLSDYRGRPVIVNFWASWCGPCKDEFPLFRMARSTHASDGLEILGIVYKDATDAAAAFMRDERATWPMLLDPDGAARTAYQVAAIPESFYLDRAGVVRAVSFGPPPGGSLDALLARILGPAGTAAP